MAYITYEYYTTVFLGTAIPEMEFARLAADASELVDSMVQFPVTQADAETERFKRAVCYQVEQMHIAGGIAAQAQIAADGQVKSVSNDGYSESYERVENMHTLGGIPISTMTEAILRKLGYLNRWVFAGGRPRPCRR